MKIIILCLCFLLCGCQTSFQKDNMDLNQLKETLYEYFEYPMSEDITSLKEPLRSQLNQVDDKLVLSSPFSYPKEVCMIVHSNDKKWISYFQAYLKQLQSEYPDIDKKAYQSQYVKIGTIYQYTYFIVSKNQAQITKYLLGM